MSIHEQITVTTSPNWFVSRRVAHSNLVKDRVVAKPPGQPGPEGLRTFTLTQHNTYLRPAAESTAGPRAETL